MFIVILCSGLAFLFLAFVLARYAPNPDRLAMRREDELLGAAPRIAPGRLRVLVGELLEAMGVSLVAERGDERRLLGVRPDPLRDMSYVVFIEPDPPGDRVSPTSVLELIEHVKAEAPSIGLLVTPYRIAAEGLGGGLEVAVELIDGARLRQLFATWLPSRLAEIDGYRGFGRAPLSPVAPARPRVPQPV